MRLTGNRLLVHRLVTTTLYKLLRLVFITVQRVYWQLNGTAQKLRRARLPHNYQRSAQVLDVLLCHRFSIGQTLAVEDFLCTHNRFEDPQYIIDNENITLMTINEHDAVFCEAKEKGRQELTLREHQYSGTPCYYDYEATENAGPGKWQNNLQDWKMGRFSHSFSSPKIWLSPFRMSQGSSGGIPNFYFNLLKTAFQIAKHLDILVNSK